MESYLSIANKPIFWVLCSITVLLSLAQTLLYMRQAKKTAAKIQLPSEMPKKAFKVGMVAAIGPAVGLFIVTVSLMPSIGGPMSWLRLSVVGAAATELSAATLGAQAAGVTIGGEGYTLAIMAVTWFAMALNGAGWLIYSGIFTPVLGKLRDKLSGGDSRWMAVLSGACSLGIFGYLNANEIAQDMGNTVACLAGIVSMVFIMKVLVPKHRKLAEFSLGIAMIVGIACAVLYDFLAA